MVFAQLKTLYCVDIPDLAKYVPDRPDVFCIRLTAIIGPRAAEGEESFDISVCTPGWRAEMCGKEGFVLGVHHLVVAKYDWSRIRGILAKLIENCSGESWEQLAVKLGRIGSWEFDDYREWSDR